MQPLDSIWMIFCCFTDHPRQELNGLEQQSLCQVSGLREAMFSGTFLVPLWDVSSNCSPWGWERTICRSGQFREACLLHMVSLAQPLLWSLQHSGLESQEPVFQAAWPREHPFGHSPLIRRSQNTAQIPYGRGPKRG